jgi:hypothetical protein
VSGLRTRRRRILFSFSFIIFNNRSAPVAIILVVGRIHRRRDFVSRVNIFTILPSPRDLRRAFRLRNIQVKIRLVSIGRGFLRGRTRHARSHPTTTAGLRALYRSASGSTCCLRAAAALKRGNRRRGVSRNLA